MEGFAIVISLLYGNNKIQTRFICCCSWMGYVVMLLISRPESLKTTHVGHLRPLLSLAAKLVHERSDVIVTFTVVGDFQSKLENEMDRYFNKDEAALKENIRSVVIFDVWLYSIITIDFCIWEDLIPRRLCNFFRYIFKAWPEYIQRYMMRNQSLAPRDVYTSRSLDRT